MRSSPRMSSRTTTEPPSPSDRSSHSGSNTHLLGFPQGQTAGGEDVLLRYFTALTASPVCAAPDAFGVALRSETPECGLSMTDEDALRDLWTMACQSPSMTGVGQ